MKQVNDVRTPNAKTNEVNPKSAAWNEVGGLFWTLGRKSARPTNEEINLFLKGVTRNTRVAIIGASTKELIEAAIHRDASVTVLDFSQKMCTDLRQAMADLQVEIKTVDITKKPENALLSSFEYVLSDRLINRFTRSEAINAIGNMGLLLRKGGFVRMSVKLGLYDMDVKLISEGEKRGTLSTFFNAETKTINYAAAGSLLNDVNVSHGDIPKDILLSWYRGRGQETRFESADIISIGEKEASSLCPMKLVKNFIFPDAPRTEAFVFQAI